MSASRTLNLQRQKGIDVSETEELWDKIEWQTARIADLEQKLIEMTSERDSESRWAKYYFDEMNQLKTQYAILEDNAPPDMPRGQFVQECFDAWQEKNKEE